MERGAVVIYLADSSAGRARDALAVVVSDGGHSELHNNNNNDNNIDNDNDNGDIRAT